MSLIVSIKTIRPGIAVSPTKQQYLDYVAQCYDDWVDIYESEPNGLLFGFGNYEGNAEGKWIIPNEEISLRNTMLIVSINHQINKMLITND